MIGELFRRTETRSTTIELPPRSLTSQAITGPISVTRDTLLSNVVANRCVALISDQIGAMPMHVERNGERVPTPTLLRIPEPDRTYTDFMSSLVVSMLVNGNAYILLGQRDSLGFPQAMVLLDPQAIQVTVQNGIPRYRTSRGEIPIEDVLHIRNFTLPGHVVGLGPLDYNRQMIAQSIAGDQYASGMFTTGALPDGVLMSDNELTSDQAVELKQAWIAGNGGRQRGPAVLSGGVKYQPLEFSSKRFAGVHAVRCKPAPRRRAYDRLQDVLQRPAGLAILCSVHVAAARRQNRTVAVDAATSRPAGTVQHGRPTTGSNA
jgi:phage portal protein BeeE